MAKLSKERYLVLSVDDSQEDNLKIQLGLNMQQCGGFLGSFATGMQIASGAPHISNNALSIPDLAQLDGLMSKKGSEVINWLQNQPFEDVVVMVIPKQGQTISETTVQNNCPVASSPNLTGRAASMDLVNLLEHYFQQQH